MLTPKPVQRPSWPLTTRAEMFDALDDLAAQGWRGGINKGQDGAWFIELNHTAGQQVIAGTGQRLVLEPIGGLVVITEEQCTDNYDAAE